MKNSSTEPIVHTKALVVVGGQGNGDEEQLHRTDSAQKVLTGRQDLSNSMGAVSFQLDGTRAIRFLETEI